MEEMTITCINCPVGCRMTVRLQNGEVTDVWGNTCKRGERYARQECISPERMITAVIPVQGSNIPCSVKTRAPIPKALIFECMKALGQVELVAPVSAGSVILANICNTGVDVIATRNI